MRRLLASALLALMLPATAMAQDAPPPPRARAQRGSHFIGELAVGTHLQGAGSFSWGGLLGVGGKPPGAPMRLYFVAGAQRTTDTLLRNENNANYTYDLKLTDVDIGARAYFPIARGWRLTAEATLGATLADAQLSQSRDYRTQQNLSMPHLTLGVGPHVRIIHELSVGVMARTMFVDTENVGSTGALSTWKGALGRRTTVVGSITLHW